MMNPMMTVPETELLNRCLLRSKRYLEFGCGGSTFSALASPSIEKVWSVESSAEWLGQMRQHAEIVAAEASGRLSLMHVDIGPTRDLGFPVDDSTAIRWPAYHTAVWDRLRASEIDTVLVDGRFRTACALQTMAHCGLVRLLVHDFWDRPFYRVITQFAAVVDRVDNLAVLEPLPVNDWRAFARELAGHALDPR